MSPRARILQTILARRGPVRLSPRFVEGVASRGDHIRSAKAAPRGHALLARFVLSISSPQREASPPTMSSVSAGVNTPSVPLSGSRE